jgi:hypothetical protein
VRLERGLAAAAVRLAPDHADLGAEGHVRVDGGQRQALALVGAVAGEQRGADHVAVGVDHRVEVRRAVVGVRQVEGHVPGTLAQDPAEQLRQVLVVPGQRHLAALRARVDRLERVPADEVVVELDERAVAELPRVEVVVLDLVRDEAAGQRVGRLVAVGREPLAVVAQLLGGVDRRQRRRDPAGLEGVGRVGARATRLDPELAAHLEDGVADLLVGLVGAPDLQARGTGHAVTQGADLLAADVHGRHAEELQLLEVAAVQLLDDRPGVGALDLEPPHVARHGLAVRPGGRAGVVADLDVVALGALELQPVRHRRAADEDVLLLVEVEQDAVADDAALGGDRDELIGYVDREVRHAVDAQVGDQLERVRPGDPRVVHVVRLVEEHRGLPPRLLLAPPVRELRGHHGVDVGAELGVAQQLDGVAGLVEKFLQVARGHVHPSSCLVSGLLLLARPRAGRERAPRFTLGLPRVVGHSRMAGRPRPQRASPCTSDVAPAARRRVTLVTHAT